MEKKASKQAINPREAPVDHIKTSGSSDFKVGLGSNGDGTAAWVGSEW